MAQVKVVHVPYKGGAPAMLGLLQGETYAMITNFVTALPPVRANRVRTLGVTSLKRTTLAPEIPTIDESGLKGFELQQFYSIVMPAGTPPEIVQRVNQEIAALSQVALAPATYWLGLEFDAATYFGSGVAMMTVSYETFTYAAPPANYVQTATVSISVPDWYIVGR